MVLDKETAASISRTISAHATELMKPGVVSVRPGVQMAGGWLTRKPAVVVTVAKKTDAIPTSQRLPATVGGFAVDVRQASPVQIAQTTDPKGFAAKLPTTPPELRPPVMPGEQVVQDGKLVPLKVPLPRQPPKPQIPYTPPDVVLTDVSEEVTILCHASPDAGWTVLSEFLAAIGSELTVGLYDFTSRHVLDAVITAMGSKQLRLVLDVPFELNPTADQTDPDTQAALQKAITEFDFAWALDRDDPFATRWVVPSAYHIKVAIRDHSVVWLSSGNWNNSNQPKIDPVQNAADGEQARGSDRDWHVVVTSPKLAAMLEAFLENDLLVAKANTNPAAVAPPQTKNPASKPTQTPPFSRFFAPKEVKGTIRLRPVLTPDPGVYTKAVLDLINSAQNSLFVQTQYIHVSTQVEDADFMALVNAVIAKQAKGLDVRIIMSEFEDSAHLELLQNAGLDLSGVRIQNNVHNKGIVVDSSAVLVSSQNWSSAGVLHNRDAGLIIFDPQVAAYFEQIFIHDWTTLSAQSLAD